jgi:hypothetical protein
MMLGPHLFDPLLAEGLQIVLGDEVLMLDVGLREAAPEEVGDFVLGQLAIFIDVGRGEEMIDGRLTVPHADGVTAEAVMPARPAERELVSAPTVAAKAAMEAVSGMMCKDVVTETAMGEAVPSKSAATVCVTTVFVAAVVSPSEPASMASFLVTSSMGEFVGKPATAVMPMRVVPVSVVESTLETAVPGPAKFRMSAVMPVSVTFVARPAMPAALVPVTSKAVMVMTVMMTVVVIAGPGETVAMTASLTALASVSPMLAALVPMLGPFLSVTLSTVTVAAVTISAVTVASVPFAMMTFAMITLARLFVPDVAVGVISASATLGVFARSPFPMSSLAPCSLIPFGKLIRSAFAAATMSRPRTLIGIVAIVVALAPSRFISPCSAGPLASRVITLCVSIVATIVSHLVRAHFVRR